MGENFQDRLEGLGREAQEAILPVKDLKDLEEVRVRFLGRKGELTGLLRSLAQLPVEERPGAGSLANALKAEISFALDAAAERLKNLRRVEAIDVSLPGRVVPLGRLHPITQVMNEVVGTFVRLGFEVAEGPEVELDYYNFEALNMPADHPARDMQDTFYVSDRVVLRTHTSPIQVRVMEKRQPPLRVIGPGRAFRCDSDVSHTPMFHQVEGFMVDEDVSMAHLKAVLSVFAEETFGAAPLRFRPSFFPFTEPSAEVDIQCTVCRGAGCRVCKGTGWMEILGAGMIDPEVFRIVGVDSERWSGFAFGMGIERIALLKYGIDDIRLFYENDLRFLRQF
ncbi:MAG: phenylalanine--tRNA ligase subunit alpha [Pseudomonadota bacterium]